jgi:hypothetical protein
MRFVLLTGKGKRLPFNYLITSYRNYKPCRIKLEQEQQKQQQAPFQREAQKDTPHQKPGDRRVTRRAASRMMTN